MVGVRQLNTELLDAEFDGQEIRKTEFFEFYNLDMKKDKLSLDQGQYVMERRLQELQFVVSPSQKSTPRDGNCLPESLFDQAQYVPALAGVVGDAFELRVQVVLSLEQSVKQGLLVWPGGDETMELMENDFGTMKQWKQKMLRPGTYGDAGFLRLASLYLETDIFLIPALERQQRTQLLATWSSELRKQPVLSRSICSTSQSRNLKTLTIRVFVQQLKTTFFPV